ncbi:nitrous oxide reductase accessory protein NosL [Natronorubrum sulfidifaciens]|uniref:Lipoprotein n=1 Tax=Natronorubrum sulfidifaciens JCM 14089 TaxID=1230460 RepID=L9W232_9EURY|nr:nitrous oxide reductase accessory protein NosL [Natronorubrum sulfidifaciens]ELY43361.1 lipoprotein [Natronorubrum sulfidifaciens JCM 14089]
MTERGGRLIGRRRLLGLLGTGAAASVAGCLGGNGADGADGDDDRAGTAYDPNVEEHPGDDPIEFSDTQACAVCNMTPTDYPQWQSQLAHEDGTGAVFDTPGCLFAYLVATSSESPVVGAWSMEYGTTSLVDATEAHFVLITDADAADDPMDINPRVFADHDDAVAYLEEWDPEDLTEDDIIGLEDVDFEVASIYRGNRL